MKKSILFFFFCNFLFSQTILEENFNALGSPITLPSGWTVTNQSNPIGTSSWFRGNTSTFTSFNGPSDGYIAANYQSGAGISTLSNWLMSPVVTVQNGDEVSFYTRVPGSQYPDRMELRLSTQGSSSLNPSGMAGLGSYTTLCTTVNPNLNVGGYPTTWTKITYVVTGLTGQVACRFALRYYVTSGGLGDNSDYVGIDAFNVKRPVLNDLALESVNVPPFMINGNFTFNGVVRNSGTNNITSYVVNWQSNGGMLNSHTVSGVNIVPGSIHNFSHSVPFVAVAGTLNTIIFNIPTVNSTIDGNTADNTLNRSTNVATGTTTFKPLIEKFTSSTCAPCASYNNATFNPYYTAQNQNFNYIAYQMNWPGAGDPYYTAEGGVRRGFYGVNAITSLWIDGAEYSTSNNQATLTAHVNNEATKLGYFQLTANRNLSGNNAVVNYSITPYITANYTLHAAVIEKVTSQNISSNGETSFKHVMMKMVPNASGTPISFVAGTSVTGQISASLVGTNIEEATDLEVIVFIQNPVTKEIMQSFKATDALSLDDNSINQVKLYPNPANSFFKLSNIEIADISIVDVMGKTVLTQKNVSTDSTINIADLNSGIYFVTIHSNDNSQTIKFAKK